jgi:hypothetical protein
MVVVELGARGATVRDSDISSNGSKIDHKSIKDKALKMSQEQNRPLSECLSELYATEDNLGDNEV